MTRCLRYFRFWRVNEEEEKRMLLNDLRDAAKRARSVVSELTIDRDLCDADIIAQAKRLHDTQQEQDKMELRRLFGLKKQIMAQLKVAHARLSYSEAAFKQTRFNRARVEEAKKYAKTSERMKNLNVDIDRLSDDTKVFGDLLSDQQRAADSTQPYSGGLAMSGEIGDDEFISMLSQVNKQLEYQSIEQHLKRAPKAPSAPILLDGGGGGDHGGGGGNGGIEVNEEEEEEGEGVERDIRTFLIEDG